MDSTATYKGGIYLNYYSKLYLHNAFVCVNTASGLGGGMFVQSQAQFTKGFGQFIGPDNDIYYN